MTPSITSAYASGGNHRPVERTELPPDWPNRPFSRSLESGTLCWHLQDCGSGPAVLLLHGTGSATHSWAGLLPLLASRFRVIAPDLPGHGFTRGARRGDLSLDGMAEAIAAMLEQISVRPELVLGHSAGAAVALRLALDESIQPTGIIGINAALMPYGGSFSRLLQPLALLAAETPPVAAWFSARASRGGSVERLIESTGSNLDPQQVDWYRQLLARKDHVRSTLGMMASWRLEGLLHDLPGLKAHLRLLVGRRDRSIAPSQANRVRHYLRKVEIEYLDGLGHLAHEQAPEQVNALVQRAADDWGIA